jgi:site-specific recombinase XerD
MEQVWIADLLERFATAQAGRGLAANTIRHRSHQLRRYLEHVGPDRVWHADHRDVEAWLAPRALGSSAHGRALSDVAVFYRWARREELTTAEPTVKLDRPRRPRAVPRPAPDGVVLRALRHSDPRLAAAVALMAYAGLRCCEVSRASWGDVDWTAAAVYVTGKGGHRRWVPIVPPLEPYLRRLEGLEAGDPIVPKGDGLPGPLSSARISQRVNLWLRACSAGGPRVTAHQLRHWYATQALARTGNLITVQQLLGHADVSTTQVYAAIPAGWAHQLRDLWPD